MPYQSCRCCGGSFVQDQMLQSGANWLCLPCFQVGFFVDELTGSLVPTDETIQAIHILPSGRETNIITARDNVILVQSTGSFYTQHAINVLFFSCADCGESFSDDLAHVRRGGRYCIRCAPPEPSIVHLDAGSEVFSESFNECESSRCYGIEIEVQYGYESSAANNTVFGSKEDGSLHNQGVEFCSPILQGDAGFAELENILKICNDNGAEIDKDCGLHVHIDLRDFKRFELVRLFYILRRIESVTRLLVTKERNDNGFCNATLMQVLTNENEGFDSQVVSRFAGMERYSAYNFLAWNSHKTIEIRLHHGTLNYEEICNWILLHLAIVDYAKNNTEETFEHLQDMNLSGVFEMLKNMGVQSKVIEYYVHRLERLGNTHLIEHATAV